MKPGMERPVLNDCLKMGTQELKAYIVFKSRNLT